MSTAIPYQYRSVRQLAMMNRDNQDLLRLQMENERRIVKAQDELFNLDSSTEPPRVSRSIGQSTEDEHALRHLESFQEVDAARQSLEHLKEKKQVKLFNDYSTLFKRSIEGRKRVSVLEFKTLWDRFVRALKLPKVADDVEESFASRQFREARRASLDMGVQKAKEIGAATRGLIGALGRNEIQLDDITLQGLKAVARAFEIQGYSNLNKPELMRLIQPSLDEVRMGTTPPMSPLEEKEMELEMEPAMQGQGTAFVGQTGGCCGGACGGASKRGRASGREATKRAQLLRGSIAAGNTSRQVLRELARIRMRR